MTLDLKLNDDFTKTQAFIVELLGTYILVYCIITAGEQKAGKANFKN